ncbi:MAG: hypothetical protein Q8L45_14690 [Xanthomonadaceae bacterium]|nr:hypothetical protein [Xanthomonadaceae bacterium]MDP2186050.1 hypothetical protein [Xanthomonadales bacterium]MDZ4116472.1 hypothetical protein [Xanthomonadaceae bacterium]MDZ4377082.1 hypothetical protein [Xanthomonadaceae bacterium]
MQRNFAALIVAFTAALMSVGAHAHNPAENAKAGDMASLVDQSNLVFLGTAAKVEYRNARGTTKGEGLIPYTVVTYRIVKVLRGKAPGDVITMRMIGGPDGTGRFLTVSGVPIIQAGDQDLFFVGDTSDASCPLVYCERGRFRILDDRVYDTFGSPVRSVSKATVLSRGTPPKAFRSVRFPAPTFDQLMKNPAVAEQLKTERMSIDVARRRYEAEAPKFVEFAGTFTRPKSSADAQGKERYSAQDEKVVAMPLSEFLAETQRLATLSKRRPAEVKSIDPKAEIMVAKIAAVVPQKIEPRRLKAQADDEAKAYEQNEFNPVIRK